MDDIIGSLGIQIEADASDLPGQYDAAVAASESAAERIASAFESVVGIGEALAITEGLKEFGTEALNAYGTVQSVTVAITNLTGSATEAGDAIEAVKQIAATQPFAFPELAPTAQRMIALGIEVGRLPLVLQTAANTAAATGNSIDAVANSLERMALSGNAGARQLVQLGLNTQQLGIVMGVSADQVKKAFAAMDESQRLDVLTTALEKFSGAAIAQANTVKGAWQILQNQFEEVMVGVGAALEPAIKDVITFGTTAVHYAQEAVDAFNSLPEPVKEFAGAAALATASIAPLAVAVGTLGLGITGISAALGPLEELMGVFGAEAATAAVAEGEVATEAAAVVEAVGSAGLAFGGVEVVIGAVGAALVGLQLKDQIEQWKEIYSTLKNNSDVFFGLEKDIKSVTVALVDLAGQTVGFSSAWDRLANVIKATPIQDFLGGPIRNVTDGLHGLNTVLQITAGTLPAADAMVKQVSGSFQTMADKAAIANPVLQATIKAFEDSKKPIQESAAAIEDWWKAVDKLPKAYDGLITSADAFLAKERDVTTSVGYAKSVLDSLMATQDGSAEHQRAVNDALTQYVDKLKASGSAMTDQITLTVNGVQVITTLGNAIQAVKDGQGDWNSVMVNGVSVLRDHAAATSSATTGINQLGSAASANAGNMGQFSSSVDGVTSAVNVMTSALDNADRSMQAFASGASETLGKTTAQAIGSWAIAAGLSGNTELAWDSAVDSQGRSPMDAYRVALQAEAVAQEKAAASTTSHTTATTANVSALTSKTAATTTAATATGVLATTTTNLATAAQTASSTITQYNGLLNNSSITTTDALGNVTTAYTTTAQAAQQFVDGLGNVYNSYQALVDAIRNNPLLAGPAQSQSGNGTPGSGPSTAPGQQYVDGMGNVYSSLSALQQALAANPGLAGPHQSSGSLQTFTPASGGNSTNYTIGGVAVSQAQYEASLRGGGASFTNPYSYTPTTPGTSPGFGSSPAGGGGGGGVTVVINYPQFNSQQQSQQVINQVVAQLRTVTGLKL